jgi:hypothetical protein
MTTGTLTQTQTTATTQDTNTAHWQARALELARQRHLTGTAQLIGTGEVGQRIYRVPSRSEIGLVYLVQFFTFTGRYFCGCHAGCWDRACSHAGAVVHAERQRAAAERETGPSQEWRYWLHTSD